MLNIIITFIFTLFMLSSPTQLLANDDALYATAPPVDASFVRFIGFETGEVVQFSGKDFTMKSDEADAYVPVSSADLNGIPAGSFYSLLKNSDGAIVTVQEGLRDDPTKIVITLLNGSDQVLSLRVADGSMEVITDIAASSSGQRSVNPIKIELGVFNKQDTNPIASFDVALRRGQNITFFTDHSGVRIIEDRFGANAE